VTTAVFADTLFYVAILNRRDVLHDLAMKLASHQNAEVVTTEFVLLEVANFFRQQEGRAKFATFVQGLKLDSATLIVPAESSWFWRGLDRFTSRPDKEWSLTDCISFVVMEDRGLTEALTADHHFEQAGFDVLLKR
jgi:hypothetical protein